MRCHPDRRSASRARFLGSDDLVGTDGARRARHGGDMAMGQRALDGEGLLARGRRDPAPENAAQPLDAVGRRRTGRPLPVSLERGKRAYLAASGLSWRLIGP